MNDDGTLTDWRVWGVLGALVTALMSVFAGFGNYAKRRREQDQLEKAIVDHLADAPRLVQEFDEVKEIVLQNNEQIQALQASVGDLKALQQRVLEALLRHARK